MLVPIAFKCCAKQQWKVTSRSKIQNCSCSYVTWQPLLKCVYDRSGATERKGNLGSNQNVKKLSVTVKCSFQSSWGILMENRPASVRHFCHASILPGHGIKQRNRGKHSPRWQGWPWLHCQDRSSDLLLRQQVCHPVYWFGEFSCITLKRKKYFLKKLQDKLYLFQLFAFLWLEVQNKNQWTFLISYNCKLIPFIYPHFMQQVRGRSYKQSLSWNYSPFLTVQISIMCSGHVT